MEFKQIIHDDTGYEEYINDRYHIVNYSSDNKYRAFFKPAGWVNFGNSCQVTQANIPKTYPDFESAKKICEKHFKKYGNYPQPLDRI